MGWDDRSTISEMVGKVFTKVIQVGDEEVLFTMEDGSFFKMHHQQDCCEHVYLQDVCGDLDDLAGTPILQAEERDSEEMLTVMKIVGDYQEIDDDESHTWTFYSIRTIKGTVDFRWYGSSNGYYSEGVDIEFHDNKRSGRFA